jgi:O-antigen/teichoic acid export membrane protein
VAFLGSLVLTRLYIPEQFGSYAQFSALVGIISIIATLRFDGAIAVVENNTDEDNLIHLLMLTIPLISLFCTVIVLLLESIFSFRLIDQVNLKWSTLIVIGSILQGIAQVLSFRLTREKRFRGLSIIKVVQPTLFVFAGFLFSRIFNIQSGLVYAAILSQLFVVWVQVANSRRVLVSRENFSFKQLKLTFSKFSNFPKYYFPHSFVDSFQLNAVIFMIGNFFSTSDLGQYSLANRVLRVPANIKIRLEFVK